MSDTEDSVAQESGTPRPGELERYAIEQALHAARRSVFWPSNLVDRQYGYIDYFEATVSRNFEALRQLEELGDDVVRRGIIPQDDSDQAKLVTDGGETERVQRDPEDDPFACSLCGCYLGEAARVSGDDYCEACQYDDSRYVRCETCGDRLPESRATAVDVSPPDEYYPEFIYFCPTDASDTEPTDEGGASA